MSLAQLESLLKGAIEQMEGAVEGIEAKATTTETKAKSNDEAIIDLRAQLESVQKAMERLNKRKSHLPWLGFDGQAYESPGASFQKSEQLADMLKKNGKKCDAVEINGSFFKHYNTMKGYGKNLNGSLTSSSTSGGALVDDDRIPGVVMPPRRMPRLRDLLRTTSTQSNSIEYVEETGFNDLFTYVDADSNSGQPVLNVDSTSGFYTGQTVVVDDEGVEGKETLVILSIQEGVSLTFTGNLANNHTAANGVSVTSETFVFTSECKLKPRARITYTEQNVPVKTLATWLPATRQILEDAAQLRSMIDGRLMEALMLSEETQMLYGDGTTDQLQGILTHPSAQSYAWSSGTVGDTKIDAIRRAMTLAALAHYPVDGIVLNELDWEDIELTKGDDGHYILAPVMAGSATMMMWRATIVVTTAINSGDFLVGAFGLAAEIRDRQQAGIRVSDQHEDFFVKNMMVVLAEERLAFVIYRPEAFVVGDFDSAPV